MRTSREEPYFSICIPQYNRTSFLVEALRSLEQQTCRDFEICIADDRSTDGQADVLLAYLERSGLAYTYQLNAENKRYDGNLRESIRLSKGQYLFLLGNDDALTNPRTLENLRLAIENQGKVGVVITNYEDFATGASIRRVSSTELVGSGADVAVSHFRNFSFVSGIVLHGSRARALHTDRWDGSEMYQMYLGCRLLAEGLPLLTYEPSAVRKDIRIAGQEVDSYARRPRERRWPPRERPLPFNEIGRLVADAVAPGLEDGSGDRVIERAFAQLLCITYPFWLFEYRKVQSFVYTLGVAFAMRPSRILRGVRLSRYRVARIWAAYLLVTTVGLTIPPAVFFHLYPLLYRLAKSNSYSPRAVARLAAQ